tara:strand:- start:50 stop:757 length:708 start_codon:yes stop_codon:yes gene_type:complete
MSRPIFPTYHPILLLNFGEQDFSSAMLQVSSVPEFLSCFWRALENVTVVPHTMLGDHMEPMVGGAPSVSSADGTANDASVRGGGYSHHSTRGGSSFDLSTHGGLGQPPKALWAKVRTAVRYGLVSRRQRQKSRWMRNHPTIVERNSREMHPELPPLTLKMRLRLALAVAQRYSLPLLLGIFVALLWANLAADSYEYAFGVDSYSDHLMPFGKSAVLFDHKITLHFLVPPLPNPHS